MRQTISDERLTAYLDGALSDADMQELAEAVAADDTLAERLAALDVPLDDLRAAMTPQAMGAPQMPTALLAANAPQAPNARKLWAPAAIAAAFVAGIAVTSLMPRDTAQPLGWVDAVASYQALYVTETLSAPRQPKARTAQVLARAGSVFDLTLDPALEIEGMTFKRAQMLGWNGNPLLQIAYLTPDGTPMALCLTQVAEPDRGLQSGTHHQQAGVSWVRDGVGYYLVGGQDITLVETMSQDISARL